MEILKQLLLHALPIAGSVYFVGGVKGKKALYVTAAAAVGSMAVMYWVGKPGPMVPAVDAPPAAGDVAVKAA